MSLLTPAQMVAEYGSHYKEGAITIKDLHSEIFAKSDTDALFLVKKTNDTRIDNVNMSLTSVLQPFYSQFSHLGVMDFEPNPWYLDRVKINVKLKPDDLAATALDFLSQRGVERKKAPIVAVVAKYLIMKAKEDAELFMKFKGVRNLPIQADQDLRVPGAPVDAGNGIRKYIRDYTTAAKANTIAVGAVPADPATFVTYIETFYASIPQKIRVYIKWIAMSKTLETRFKLGMRAKYNVNYAQASDLASIIDTTVSVRGFLSHEGSDMIWTTIPENCIGFDKMPENKSVFDIATSELYDVLMGTDWYTGRNFINPYWLYTNGQDLA